MSFYSRRSDGKTLSAAVPAALLSSALFSSCLASSCLVFAHAATAAARRPVKKPTAAAAPRTGLTLKVPGRAASPVQSVLVQDDGPPVGANNAVKLWVRGDSSGANLRVRVLAPAITRSPAANSLPRDTWISTPIPITFTGWREFVLPKSKFTLRAAPPLSAQIDLALPASAQPPGNVVGGKPDWSAATGVGLDVTTSRQAMLVVDNISWATLDADGQGTGSTPVADFEKGNVGAWKPLGTPEEAAAVSYGLATQAGLTHNGKVAFRVTVTPPGLGRPAQAASARTLAQATRRPFLIWTPASLFERVLPDSLPARLTSIADVNLSACPDQIQAATFCLYAPAEASDVTVTLPTDLQGIGRTLPKSLVDVHVVKVWNQAGAGALRDPDTAGDVPELLVKDDRVPLSGTAPAMRLTGPSVCDIAGDTSKQFWLTVSVPPRTPAGQYVGKLLVSGRGLPPTTVRMTLNVLPLRLLSPAKQYGVDLRSRLDPAPAALPAEGQLVTDFVSKEVLDTQLRDIALHGFTIASLYDSPATLGEALAEYKANGLGTAYNLYKGDTDPQQVEKARRELNGPTLTYYTDPEPLSEAQARMGPLSDARIPSVTYIPHQADFDALGSKAEILIYNRDSEYPQQLLRTKGKRISMTRDWWYWPASDEDPHTNRADAGYLLWRANLYGAFLPDYQTAFGTDPYNDTSAGAAPSHAAFRPQMLTYPVQGGVLDTLQWEACREGVTDVRYLTTMYAALREAKDAHIAKPLIDEAETYVKTFLDKPLANLPDGDYDTARAKVADYALKLRKAVDAYNKAHGVR